MERSTLLWTVAPLWLAALFVACASSSSGANVDDAPDGAAPPSFTPTVPALDPLQASDASLATRAALLFGTTCQGGPETSCHGSGGGPPRLLGDGDLVNVPSTERPELARVRPGDVNRSYLFLKVAGDGGIDGDVMPPSFPHDPRVPGLLGAWIAAGAATP